MLRIGIWLILSFVACTNIHAQVAEPQISFAQESRPHDYYVVQAELWAKELAKDSLSEDAWYNYFRACRNAHGTADWRSDFVDESPFLQEGSMIVERIRKAIPGTFTAHYVSYLTNGIGTGNADDLLTAYAMKPDFPGIHSSVVSYAESKLDPDLRKATNQRWHATNYLSSQLLTYSYNLLMSLQSDAILFVQSDNDTYTTWMLQDALGIRPDVTVINIDFLLLDDYREATYSRLGVQNIDLGTIDLNEYRHNWQLVVARIVDSFDGERPLYFSMTLYGEIYEKYASSIQVSGLALQYKGDETLLVDFNRRLFTEVFHLDSLHKPLTHDHNQRNVDLQNTNYLSWLKELHSYYRSQSNHQVSGQIRNLAITIAARVQSDDFSERIAAEFQ